MYVCMFGVLLGSLGIADVGSYAADDGLYELALVVCGLCEHTRPALLMLLQSLLWMGYDLYSQ